jgi:hypothetical protein
VHLVEREKTQALRGTDQVAALVWSSENQLQHEVVGQQDVGWLGEDAPPLIRLLLPGVAGKGDRLLAVGLAEGQKLFQLADLGIRQGVHWVNDDGLDTGGSRAVTVSARRTASTIGTM